MRDRGDTGGFEVYKPTGKTLSKEDKINGLVKRINEAVKTGFTGTIRFGMHAWGLPSNSVDGGPLYPA